MHSDFRFWFKKMTPMVQIDAFEWVFFIVFQHILNGFGKKTLFEICPESFLQYLKYTHTTTMIQTGCKSLFSVGVHIGYERCMVSADDL